MKEDNKTFCMAPWIHLHVWPNGNVYPCCTAPADKPIGSTREESLETVWNNETMRELRTKMLAGEKHDLCSRCYLLEENGSWSMRKDMNRKFGDQIDIVDVTEEDGTLQEMRIKYMDIRLSNICNFKCRSCGPQLSSKWHEDNVIMYGDTGEPRIDRPFETKEELWKVLEPILDTVEEIYFAGGEPLVMTEHYDILDFLIEHNRTDVRLLYNTNFSKLRHAGKDVIEYWNQFSDVRLGASLDAMGKRAEYMRSGTVWHRIEDNMITLREKAPHVQVFVSATVSLFNAWHVIDFYKTWVDKGFIDTNEININMVHQPDNMAVTVLPPDIKHEITKKYEYMIEHILPNDFLKDSFRSIITFMNSKDDSHLIRDFFVRNDKLDVIRKEKFEDVFPELQDMRSYIEQRK